MKPLLIIAALLWIASRKTSGVALLPSPEEMARSVGNIFSNPKGYTMNDVVVVAHLKQGLPITTTNAARLKQLFPDIQIPENLVRNP